MNRLGRIYCDYCGFELKEGSQDGLVLACVEENGHHQLTRVDACGVCLLLKLQAILNVYRLEDDFLRDIFGLVPASVSPGWRFSREAINPSSPFSKLGLPRLRLSRVLPLSITGFEEGISEDEEQLREEIDILKERQDHLEEKIGDSLKFFLRAYIQLGDTIGDLKPGLEDILVSFTRDHSPP